MNAFMNRNAFACNTCNLCYNIKYVFYKKTLFNERFQILF